RGGTRGGPARLEAAPAGQAATARDARPPDRAGRPDRPSRSAPARAIERGLKRLHVALARVGRAADGVDLRAAGLERLLAQDRLGAVVYRLRARAPARELAGLPPRELLAGGGHADLDDRERRGEGPAVGRGLGPPRPMPP